MSVAHHPKSKSADFADFSFSPRLSASALNFVWEIL
jgi:hypothetical protein